MKVITGKKEGSETPYSLLQLHQVSIIEGTDPDPLPNIKTQEWKLQSLSH